MYHQDQRKRAFSQAFQRMNQPRHSCQDFQPAKRILSYPFDFVGLFRQEADVDNEAPLDLDADHPYDDIPGTQIRHARPLYMRHDDPGLYSHASLQYELYGNRPGLELQDDTSIESVPSPLLHNQQAVHPPRHDSLSAPPIVCGQSMFGPSPYIRSDFESPLYGSVVTNAQPSFVDSPMSDATTAIAPLTPSALNFGDLTLNSQGYSLPSSPLHHNDQGGRATIRVVPISSFIRHFSEMKPNEVVILLEKGKSLVKVDKHPLCGASRFFAQLLDGPFLDHGLTRCIRLRDDFPYAVTTMLHFIGTGEYLFDQRAFTAYPLLTALDLHVHTYLAGNKYAVVALQDHAIKAYLDIAEHELKLGFLAASSGYLSEACVSVPGFPVVAPAEEQEEGETVITPIDRFLNSLVVLWRNTQSRIDTLRRAVLELIKRNLNKLLQVTFFVTLLQEVVGFGDDVLASLVDDGFEVKAFQSPAGGRLSRTIRFQM